ncbi:DUF4390 domain-containing protein [Neisseria perflava]|uniref:DUF4390 domain-containing protein n=1 Tax=Neisseria perflava TaxID=33053 RepID=UPI00209FFF85|nr:DUF4390 domain-containing protein [Neisseria perflava]MCP1660048.1 hypothetical protein [Neisseria perflava]MCP1771934.1 hypothetical protein [Neisseria perflava]
MAFITRLSRNCKTGFQTALAALSLAVLLFAPFQTARAEGISPTRAEARLTDTGQLAISSRFQTELPDQLKQALRQGVPLQFTLVWQLSAPKVAAYKFKLAQLVNDGNNIQYKLSYHPLTNRYRVTVGTFSSEYDTLEAALRGVGAVANWKVLDKGELKGVKPRETKAEIRLQLSIDKLPKPFQINALTSKNWHLDSGWKSLSITKE